MKLRKLGKAYKQLMAGALSAAMVLSGLPALGGSTAHAAVLQDEHIQSKYFGGTPGSIPTYASGESTAYTVGNEVLGTNNGVSAVAGTTFNISAILQDSDRTNGTAGYNNNVKTAYGSNWWHTRYGFGGVSDVVPNITWSGSAPTSASAPPAANLQNFPSGVPNGKVVTLQKHNDANQKVEVRRSVKISDDDQYVIIEYTVHNLTGNILDFWIGNETDTQMHASDDCPIILTDQDGNGDKDQGITMFASHSDNGEGNNPYQFTDFKLLTHSGNPELGVGVTKRNSSDPSELRSWIGHWSDTAGIRHENYVFVKGIKAFANVGDSAAAFSAYMNLAAHETKTARFAVRMRTAVYYVDPTYTGASNGFIAKPYKSIQDAVDAMQAANVKKGYIALQSNVTVPATINIPGTMDITLTTSEFERPSHAPSGYESVIPEPVGYSAPRKTITRGATATGALFNVAGGGKLTVGDVTIDGANVLANEALITASNGEVRTRAKSQIINGKINPVAGNEDKASAISITGTAKLEMRNGVIKDNTSYKGSAVYVKNTTGGDTMDVANNITLTGNKNSDNKPANVRLGENNRIIVDYTKGLDSASRIGISVDQAPTTSTMGTLAVNYDTTQSSIVPYSGGSFSADKDGTSVAGGSTANTVTGTSSTPQTPGFVYIHAGIYSLNVYYIDSNGNAMSNTALHPGSTVADVNDPGAAAGKPINIPLPAYAGWSYASSTVNPAGALSVDNTGKVTGSMPNSNVNVTIKYQRDGLNYKFDPNNGGAVIDKYEPVNPGASGSTLGALPVVSRTGFDFGGWFEFNDANNSGDYDAGEEIAGGTALTAYPAPHASTTKYYYAKWNPGTGTYPFSVAHRNSNVSLPLTFGTSTDNYTVTTAVTKNPANVPGYLYASATRTPTTQGNLNATTGNYSVAMPALGISLQYKYTVNTAVMFNLNVLHVDAGGNAIATVPALQRRAEQAVNLAKRTIPGYTYSNVVISQGATANPTNYEVGFEAPLLTNLDTTNGVVQGFMPNQDVTVKFIYNSDSASTITRRFLDRENITRTIYADSQGQIPGGSVNLPLPTSGELYGYTYDASSSVNITPAGTAIAPNASGALLGTMPVTGSVIADYRLSKDMTKWQHINFALTSNSVGTATIAPTTSTNPVLLNDGTAAGMQYAQTFGSMRSEGVLPTVTPDPYHKVEGWYVDQAGTTPLTDSMKLDLNPAGTTIYVKLVEDPSKWVDIDFATSDPSLGTVNPVGTNVPGGSPQHLHFDEVWSNVVVPPTSPIANYEVKNWTSPLGTIVNATDTIVAGTYKANFGKVNSTWGLVPGAFGATGQIGFDGSGEINVNGTQPGNVYVVTDPDGVIVAVLPGPPTGNELQFTNLVPGRTYNVVEGGPDTTATVGQPQTSIAGSSLSTPRPVTIPAIDTNRAVGADPNNEGRAQIVINPADPDAEYALIDSNGNVVQYPGSNNGWVAPRGSNPATVIFDDLDIGETYTVVARKKNNPSETPLGNLHAGVQVVANPGDMVEALNYTIETRTNGIGANVVVSTVAGNAVNAPSFDQAHANDAFAIHADPTDANGNPFLYWVIMNGRIPGVAGRINSNDYTGTLSRSNVVFRAVYDIPRLNPAGERIAPVEESTRGGSEGEFALDPNGVAQLEQDLSNPTDVSLINVNGADVRYKVVFNKRGANSTEVNVVKTPSALWANYPDAFTAAFALDIKEERYVNGRLVQNASPSNAQLKAVVQLDNQDADMLDYEIWDLGPNVDSTWNATTPTTATQIAIVEPVADNAGLFSFDANINHTYVLVYAKTFKLSFTDNTPVKDHQYLDDVTRNFFKKIKVRKHDFISSGVYATDYSVVTAYANGPTPGTLVSPFDGVDGVTYTYQNWSKKPLTNVDTDKDMEASWIFDPNSQVTKTMPIYAYYKTNRRQVQNSRTELGDLINTGNGIALDPYLKAGEAQRLVDAIREAQNVLDRRRGRLESGIDPLRMANYPELQAAINALRAVIDDMNRLISQRNALVGGRISGGGGTGTSGRGFGIKNNTFRAEPQITFTLGVDGNWAINPATNKWSFILQGGLPLNNKWAKIQYSNDQGRLVTDWYRFDKQSSLITGWYRDDSSGKWYYMSEQSGKKSGIMQTGWLFSNGKWYYLDPVVGEMYVGWHMIGEQWYYFSVGNDGRPYGSLYISEATPDGYHVNHNGEWIR